MIMASKSCWRFAGGIDFVGAIEVMSGFEIVEVAGWAI